MASLYKRTQSPFWWIKFRDPDTGETKRKSTQIRITGKDAKRQARKLQLQAEMLENSGNPKRSEEFKTWVVAFLEDKYRLQPPTLKRYLGCWAWLDEYFEERDIRTPRQFQYQDAIDYVTWRTQYKKRGKGTVSTNTALIDLKVLRIILRHAVRSGFCEFNPCEKLGIRREDAPQKPEITDAEIATIRRGLKGQPKWMRYAFEIALNTGCRISETQIDFKNIDFELKTIFFAKPKGGVKKAFKAPLPDAIIPMLKEIKATGAQTTLTLPPLSRKIWWKFFKEIGLPHLCFHCTRVTYVTRGCRNNIPEPIMRKLVNHSDELVHRVYQRLNIEDVQAYANKIPLPSVAESLSTPAPLPV